MGADLKAFAKLKTELEHYGANLVAVSKTKTAEDIRMLYNAGQRAFGENYVQEMVAKAAELPKDVQWHFIGHLQSNKVKYIAEFVHLIQSVDSFKLLKEINKQAEKADRKIKCLLQVHIALEETKFGLDERELAEIIDHAPALQNVAIAGLMGMASFSKDESQVAKEFESLNVLLNKHFSFFQKYIPEPVLSMGMSGDYQLALKHGSNLVRIGSLLFGSRNG